MKKQKQIPDGFMDLLPDPATYYAAAMKLSEPDEFGWADGVCPLDRYPMGHRVRVDLLTGRFACPTCGRGDMILFHMLFTRLSFKPAVLQLIEMERPK